MQNVKERVFIIRPLFKEQAADEEEICELVRSAGAEVAGERDVRIREISPAAYIGTGKLEEIKEAAEETGDIDLVVFDGELSPSQTVNMSTALGGISVVDRTTLILDIFARNAVSSEGKLQVELAQLRYLYPRLKGKGAALSRLGGGIGTRGPGETKLETDRRHIRLRIRFLEERLKELETRRVLQKERRRKNNLKTVAIVGYTNAGKSTLMNALTDAGVLAEDRLFATLDPTVKKLRLPSQSVALIDTVGFVRNIPHHLVEAFRSTLESALESDLVLIVSDAASPSRKEHLETTQATLDELGCSSERLVVYNKCDLVGDFSDFPENALFISAKTGAGTDRLLVAVDEALSGDIHNCELFVPYALLGEFRKEYEFCTVTQQEEREDGITIRCKVRGCNLYRYERFLR